MALIDKKVKPFHLNAFKPGADDFVTVSDEDIAGKWTVFFFYPADFTFVCPTELHAFQEKLAEFESKNVQVIGCSVDSWCSHVAWLATPKKKGGIQGVTYPCLLYTSDAADE